jgi:hypothetical protein
MDDEIKNIRYKRKCGHWNDTNIYFQPVGENGELIKVVCFGCVIDILEKQFGLRPIETLQAEEFAQKYLGFKKP